jgi:hypothetical protein
MSAVPKIKYKYLLLSTPINMHLTECQGPTHCIYPNTRQEIVTQSSSSKCRLLNAHELNIGQWNSPVSCNGGAANLTLTFISSPGFKINGSSVVTSLSGSKRINAERLP